MKRLILLAIAATIALPLAAQDFGYPKDKAFYKAHWKEIVKQLDPDQYMPGAQYILTDIDNDGAAELYLWFSQKDTYFFGNQDNKLVRLSEPEYFYPHFMAPYELLLDKPVPQEMELVQHVYDKEDIPGIWFKLHPTVEGTFNIASACAALNIFDCAYLNDALYSLANNAYGEEYFREFVLDTKNGYAAVEFSTRYIKKIELCYWNLPNNEKLLALHYHLADEIDEDNVNWFEQTLFMKYIPATNRLEPIVAPIEGFDFQTEYNFSLPRKGKNITLIGADNHELTWTGNGFRY